MSVPAVLARKSTKEPVKFGVYPRQDMQPVEGLDPDYEWLIEHIPNEKPDFDPRIFVLATNIPDLQYLDTFEEHPNYPGLKEYRITYSPEKRTNEEIIDSIDNAERDANDLIISESDRNIKLVFMLTSVLKASKGLQLTPTEQGHIDELTLVNMKLSKNLDNRNLLVSQVEANQVPNIDTGWEN